MHEATRFPGDYDGVIAIVPAMGRLSVDAAHFQHVLALSKDGQMLLTTNQLKIVSDAAVAFMADKDEAYCAGRYLSDPRMCDPYAEEILDLAAKKDPVFADADIRKIVAAMARSHSSAKILDIVIPSRIITIMLEHSNSDATLEECCEIYLREYLENSAVLNLEKYWI